MAEQGLEPTHTYTHTCKRTLIHAYVYMILQADTCMCRATELLGKMTEQGLEPDVFTYTTYISLAVSLFSSSLRVLMQISFAHKYTDDTTTV